MYQLMKLPYRYDAFEPLLSYQTIYLHHDKLYTSYLERLNKLLKELNYDYRYSMVELLDHLDIFPVDQRDQVLFLLGGVLNHELYFTSMRKKKNVEPMGELRKQIEKQYGSWDAFQIEVMRKANLMVGSGYTFIVVDKNHGIEVINLSNQETPYSYGMIPIAALDLWEHSYYLDDYHKRNQYISDFFSIIDFKEIGKRYEKTIKEN